MPIRPETLARAGTTLEDQAQQVILDKLWNFATTRSLRYRLLDNADVVIAGKKEKDGTLGVGTYLILQIFNVVSNDVIMITSCF